MRDIEEFISLHRTELSERCQAELRQLWQDHSQMIAAIAFDQIKTAAAAEKRVVSAYQTGLRLGADEGQQARAEVAGASRYLAECLFFGGSVMAPRRLMDQIRFLVRETQTVRERLAWMEAEEERKRLAIQHQPMFGIFVHKGDDHEA